MNIRNYLPADWPRLCTIHDAARVFELQAAGLPDAYLTLEQTGENEGLFDGDIVVAELDGKVQGFAAWCEGELTWLYVDPANFKQGTGRHLLRHAISANQGKLDTEVLQGNQAALTLYLSEGFKIVEESQGKLAGNEAFKASGYVLRYAAE
ncbi:GNAT family N-acetyltransferase [Undibacterium pigrum]|uniref:Ribosomal protein S18 acetylase RimI-like enzyme n=1 Tax=Undibacterium pigrum TaxID=401470 RepID=A0A318IJJ1_9BURK|nr:GNAT family N-acetyltransferase [Undibacterium pigrum]PXX33708.1 ribosomal protein S18 acetylase RimI-like enzyme [Undibacterium pigrum]